jgi:hypothetical protein
MGTGPVGPGVPVAAAVETTAATENNGRRKNAPGVVRLCSAINDTAGEISGLMIPVAGSRFLGAWSYLVFGCPFEVSRPVRVSGLA